MLNSKPQPRIKLVGRVILCVGIFALILGLVLLILTGSTFSLWTLVGSILLNIVGLTLLTTKR